MPDPSDDASDTAPGPDPRLATAARAVAKFAPPSDGQFQAEERGDEEALADADQEAGEEAQALPFGGRYAHLKNLRKGTGVWTKFSDAAKDRACERYARSGVIYLACAAAGVSYETLRQHLRTDELFAEAWEEARLDYCASLEAEVHRRAVEGVREPIIGRVGKDEDGVITYVRRYSDRLLEFHAKRHIAEYRERSQVDVSVQGGVMVIAQPAATVEDALARIDREHALALEDRREAQEAIDAQFEVVDEALDKTK